MFEIGSLRVDMVNTGIILDSAWGDGRNLNISDLRKDINPLEWEVSLGSARR